jgi:hypothetical protein
LIKSERHADRRRDQSHAEPSYAEGICSGQRSVLRGGGDGREGDVDASRDEDDQQPQNQDARVGI